MDYLRVISDLRELMQLLEKDRQEIDSKITKIKEMISIINEKSQTQTTPWNSIFETAIATGNTRFNNFPNLTSAGTTAGGLSITSTNYGSYRKKTAMEHIIDILKREKNPMRAEEIYGELEKRGVDISPGTLHAHLSKAQKDGSTPIIREGYGSYKYVENINSFMRNNISMSSPVNND